MRKISNNLTLGFTLPELMVSIIFILLVLGAIYSSFTFHQKAARQSEVATEILQNGRVILERMTREIRQAKDLVTSLPVSKESAINNIEFQDGHNDSYISYIHYFRDNTDGTIKREALAYYYSLSGNPNNTSTYVVWNATPPLGESLATTSVESSRIIGEYVSDLKFWQDGTINIFITLDKGDKNIDLSTEIFSRNF